MRLLLLALALALAVAISTEAGIIKVTRCNRCCENETVIEYEYEVPVTDSPTVAPTVTTSSPTVPHQAPTKAPVALPPIDSWGCRDVCFRRHEFLPTSVRRKPLKVCGGATEFWNCSCSASKRRSKRTKFYYCIPHWVDPNTGQRRVLVSLQNMIKTRVKRPKIKGKGKTG